MRPMILLLALLTALPVDVRAQQSTLVGSVFKLEGWNQRGRGDEVLKVRVPGSATVRHPGVEFPQVSRLFDTPEGRRMIREGRIGRFVNTWIDIGPNWIEIDFDRASSGQFTSARQNTYVFVFDKAVAVQLQNPRVDRAVTTFGLAGRVRTRGNRLFVNVQGLPYNSRSFIRIRFDVRDAPSAHAPSAPSAPPAYKAPKRSPIPARAGKPPPGPALGSSGN